MNYLIFKLDFVSIMFTPPSSLASRSEVTKIGGIKFSTIDRIRLCNTQTRIQEFSLRDGGPPQ
jgi:hypothetical protein